MNSEISYRPFLNRDRLVHIVDSDQPTCDGLDVLFRLEGFQTAISRNSDDFIARFGQRRPDVVILNFDLEGEDMLPALRRIKDMRSGIPVFMLADRPLVDGTVEAMRSGASDVFVKPVDSERFVRAVRETLRRDVHVKPSHDGQREVEIRGFAQLTPREREVLQLVTNGQSNKEAGRELGISPRTIEVHRARVMEKLGARNTADLIRIVLTS
ncbi:response regulator transcription factor [Pelagibacterium halotolerans]|uniref:Two component transcriptional regulator, LuxR family protein n=1 Tax=Pelagibacterium halotolerans (strain DSM 22347 / JCM 15775 / CGMCC 1.7692 / B2) TaxID=1082931 RepID=G4R9L1_PELHB|nr:LuxR C-terminal-related transcriptional regulator [Pelagibacterium halotolerans]AEQ50431.1 two component transcriptional regulator, LuxR family protein [Pelagibacterium halotolerans B2]QJR19602.1 response regulator transcription factor [Pelagibacterium halotolerans]SDZ86941.1 two component transcriptional regulator, LuxR family [Pelagibacterium halotolerans]